MSTSEDSAVFGSQLVDINTGEPPVFIEFEAFGYRFRHILSEHAEDLVTLEKDGALYASFWDEELGAFQQYRVRLLPREIVQFVRGTIAFDQLNAYVSLEFGLNAAAHQEFH
jgi:hypothetical protein